MEQELSIATLLKAITALTTMVGTLQAQIQSPGQQIAELKAICKETADLLGDKDQGGPQTQAQPGPLTGPITPPTHTGGQANTPRMARPGLRDPFRPIRSTMGYDLEEEQPREEPQGSKKEPCRTSRNLRTLTPFSLGLDTKRPKMELPDPFKGDTQGRKAVQWLDRMLLWGALHRDQFEEDKQLIVWILYHMEDKAANWALPLIAFADPNAKRAAAQKIASLTQTTLTAEYVTKFCNLIAELDWNKEAYIAQFTRGLHWKVKELLSTKDNIPEELEAIFAAATKIDNTCCKNEENCPKKKPAKSLVTTTTTSTTTTRVCLSEDPNYVTPEERDRCRASGLCVKCGQKGHGIKQCPNGWKATIKENAKVGQDKLEKELQQKPLLFIDIILCDYPTDPIKTLIDSGATSNFISPALVEKLKIPKSLLENPQVVRMLDVFGEEEFKVLPPHQEYNIAIDLLPDAKLSPGPIYSMTDAKSKVLKQHIDKELATGKIHPSTSSTGAPVMFVKKADGSLQLVVDYRKLNKVTHKNVHPLPRQDDLMAKLRHARIFTKLDLRWGYNNVQIKEGDKWKTAFRTKYGLFEYLVMPFGLTNAPATFQHFMNNLFRDLIDITVVIYLDDILIFSEKPEEHPSHVREVLSRLMTNQLFCKLSKCHFHVTTVDYLGIVISPTGFSMDQKKIEAVTSWPTPKTVKQVQAFLGFVNYLCCFIPNFSSVAQPLYNLTKKETLWSCGILEEEAFQELKSLVTRALVLIHSNPKLPYYLKTDASGVAMGAILSQQGPDNCLHPIAYMSKLFSGAEANYDTHNKELLAIIKALEEWRIFLEATDKPIQVFTDHWNLEYWRQAQTFNCRHARWQIFLSNFNFEIHYCPGKQSGKPDALSRRSDYTDKPQEPEIMLPAEVFANTLEEELEIVMEICSKLREDPSLEQIIQFLTEDADNAPPSICEAYRDYDWEEDLLWYQGKLVVPDSETLKEQLLREFHNSPPAGHPGQQRTLELLSCNYWWPGMKSSAKEWVECCPTCQANRQAHVPVIALKPLEVPPFLFHTISYNFITRFPKSQGNNAILVVIDSFSKFGHFIPTTKKCQTKEQHSPENSSEPFTNNWVSTHPSPLLTTPTADHSDWAKWLPLAEYAYNNARHAATGKTPFKLVYGRNPVMNPSNVPANVPEADNVADTLAQEWKEAELALRMSKEKMARNKGITLEYSVGDKVWLDGKNVELRTNSNKLDPKQLGPFEITEKISSHAYCLKLPDVRANNYHRDLTELKATADKGLDKTNTGMTLETLKIHNVFYVGLLSKVHELPSQPLPDRPPPETIEGEEEYKVKQIIDSKRQRGKWFYLIKWKGYSLEDNSWEPEELLEHSQDKIKRFNQARLKKACDTTKSL
ncbi:hypothetical protein RHS01_04274 [Rhizoctonia solani]|uniref:RNA-directed DNA polymerase n=1 Tax=Rhizoctonia solani TaxID=456999 RepID=A0A8H7IEV9_9AGAM|nr:hypothetical protein RHS01_04274 [Rhizoctonia solani]